MLDSTGHLPQKLLVAGYDKYSMYDLGWQVVVETLFLYETELTGRPALRSVVRLIIKTVMQRCPFMAKQEKPLRLVKRLGLSTTIAVVTRLTEGVKYQPLLLISIAFLKVTPTTAFAVAESRIKR